MDKRINKGIYKRNTKRQKEHGKVGKNKRRRKGRQNNSNILSIYTESIKRRDDNIQAANESNAKRK